MNIKLRVETGGAAMNKRVFFISGLMLLGIAGSFGQQSSGDASKLLGKWVGQSDFGSLTLEFRSPTQIVFDGESASCSILPGIIRVQDEDGITDYRFAFQGDVLVISFPEGYALQFKRVGGTAAARGGLSENSKAEKPPATDRGQSEASPVETKPSSSVKLSGNEVGDPNWGFKFRAPAGWKFQKDQSTAILGHDTVPGMIIVMPHMGKSLDEVRNLMTEGLQEEGVQLNLAGALRSSGNNVLAGEYEGVYQGEQVKARGIGTASPYGGGAFIIALTTPSKFGGELAGAAEAIAGGMQYFRMEASDLMRQLSGIWVNMTKNTETRVGLSPSGQYFSNYESSYSGSFGSEQGNWGTAGQSREDGRWTIRGNREQGTIIITMLNGNLMNIQYRVHVENGETYWNEYWFNGDLYGRQR